ncbi:hypothetical protein EYF80_013412 [Liparis tanakae]|uniref:Uncharacterized protein n=1 Tax=Liparis tanakae TaxID=230148 RepID=A0A4Z2IGQ0_9TELE|nr:hypothetical protein EYF80_013412 [Liparis tanakae]
MDGLIAATQTHCWLQTGDGRMAFVFGTCLLGPQEHSKKEGEDRNTLFRPHCVQSSETDVEYHK